MRRLTTADIAAWVAYERASANALDQYEALPTAAFGGRMHKCDVCRTDVPAGTVRCRWCRRRP